MMTVARDWGIGWDTALMKRSVIVVSLVMAGVLAGCSAPAATSPAAPATPGATKGSGTTVQCPPTSGAAERTTKFAAAPPMCITTTSTYVAKVTTDVGAFEITLDTAKAPETVNNFVFLARNRYYDGIVFHRVIAGFMAQTGDPTGTGGGGPGYRFADELPKAGEYQLGSVAMANAGTNTNGSQFFIVTGPSGTSLPPKYSLFGRVTSGMDVVQKIEADAGDPATKGVPPKVTHTMTSVTITET